MLHARPVEPVPVPHARAAPPALHCAALYVCTALQVASEYDLAVSGDALTYAESIGAAAALIPLCQASRSSEGQAVISHHNKQAQPTAKGWGLGFGGRGARRQGATRGKAVISHHNKAVISHHNQAVISHHHKAGGQGMGCGDGGARGVGHALTSTG